MNRIKKLARKYDAWRAAEAARIKAGNGRKRTVEAKAKAKEVKGDDRN